MIKLRKLSNVLVLAVGVIALMTIESCQKDDIVRETSYNLQVQDVLGSRGTATFVETNGGTTTIDLVITGSPSGVHPAQLCMNTVSEGGTVILTLNPIDQSGESSTLVTSLDYDQLIAYDGFIKIMKSSEEPLVILAQGDIGGNVITESNITYALDSISPFRVVGTALFEKRLNGTTLLTVSLTGTLDDTNFPATINLSSIATIGGGPIVKTLNSIAGTTGKSYTNIRTLDNGMVITYDNLLVYDGYINIYRTNMTFDNIICHGNIGSN